METMLPGKVSLVAPENVILHRMGQLAQPKMDVVPHMHLHRCTHPKGPRAVVNPMQKGFHVHPKRGAKIHRQEAQ